MPIVLTMDECIRVNEQLSKATKSQLNSEVLEIISALAEADLKGRVKVPASLRLPCAFPAPSPHLAPCSTPPQLHISAAPHLRTSVTSLPGQQISRLAW
jgi:hypothetical protein